MANKKYRYLPCFVHTLLVYHDAWLVGSGAIWYVEEANPKDYPRDYDLIVPTPDYPNAVKRARNAGFDMQINNMGGTKAVMDNLEIDFWPDTLEDYCKKAREMGFGRIAAISLRPKAELIEPE